MTVRAGRAVPRSSAQKPKVYQVASINAPTLGLVANTNLAAPPPGGAFLLENFLPTATTALLRRGSLTFNRIGDLTKGIVSLFTYLNGNTQKLFAATDSGIYNASNAVVQTHISDGLGNILKDDQGNRLIPYIDTIATADISGFLSGAWSTVQFATSGGVFLDLVNGTDKKLVYNGTDFFPIGGTSLYAINYTTETAPFTTGKTLTGATSAATGIIVKVIDNGTTGTLWLDTVTGTFSGTEVISDNNTTPGSATASGAPTLLFGGFTNVDPAALSYNWVYKHRLFYVQKDSLDAWYLPVDSLTGAAVQLPLGGEFTRGGSLLFGSSWSLETGAGGLSEQCIFVSTEGEVLVFQGGDPSTAATWSKVGTYRIGKPLGPQAHFRAGGDIVISTDIGLIPLSQALQKDFAVLSPSAVSAQIETIWNEEVKNRAGAPWHCTVWSANQMAVVSPPSVNSLPSVMYVANSRTGAWGKFTGWDATCVCVFQDRMFFGTTDGLVIEANVTGSDNGQPYTGTYVPLFGDLGVAGEKATGMARAVIRAVAPVNDRFSMQTEYDVGLPTVPSAPYVSGANAWDSGVWNVSVWGQPATKKNTYDVWRSVPGTGYAMAPALQITSGSLVPLDAEIVRVDVTFQPGDVVT